MPLTAIADLEGSDDPVYRELGRLCRAHNGLWNAEAEKLVLSELCR